MAAHPKWKKLLTKNEIAKFLCAYTDTHMYIYVYIHVYTYGYIKNSLEEAS